MSVSSLIERVQEAAVSIVCPRVWAWDQRLAFIHLYPLLSTAWCLLGPLKSIMWWHSCEIRGWENGLMKLAYSLILVTSETWHCREWGRTKMECVSFVWVPRFLHEAKARVNCVRYCCFPQTLGSDQSSCCPWRRRGWRLLWAQLPVFWFSLPL